LLAYPAEKYASKALYLGLPDYDDMSFLIEFLRPNDVFVDVGANIGLYTMLGASVVKSGGRVLAFEPNPLAVQRLVENIKLNGITNVGIRHAAVGVGPGSVRITTGLDTRNHVVRDYKVGASVEVPLVSLDQETSAFHRVNLVKMDVEGFESEVLKGARCLLARKVPAVWSVEVNGLGEQYGSGNRTIYALFAEFGYQAFRYNGRNKTLHRHSDPDAEASSNLIFARDTADILRRMPARLVCDRA